MSDEKPPSYPLSDHTRRLRRNLIAVAAIGILFAKFPEVTPDKIPALGIESLVSKGDGRNIVIGAVNIICIYLLVFFVWNAMNNYWNWSAHSWREIRAMQISMTAIGNKYYKNYLGRFPERNYKTFSELFLTHGAQKISKIRFWWRIFNIYLIGILRVASHSRTLFIFDLLLPTILAAFSLYLAREHIQFIWTRVF